MNQKKTIALTEIVAERQFQARYKGRDDEHVKDLAEAYEGPDAHQIPDPVVFLITGKGYCLVDGFHRFEALCKLGRKTATFLVKSGTVKDAIFYAVGANADHGMKRTNKDKRRAIEEGHKNDPKMSNRELAKLCRVSHTLVSEVRSEMTELEEDEKPNSGNSATGVSNSPAKPPVFTGSSAESFYEKDDGTPKIEGVYTPRFLATAEGEKCIDLHGNPMPDRLGDIFADPVIRKRYAEAMELGDMFHEFWKHFEKLSKSPDYPFLELVKIRTLADQARETVIEIRDFLREAVPAIVCPDCHGAGKGCKGRCRLSGYIARGLYDLDPEYQKLRRK